MGIVQICAEISPRLFILIRMWWAYVGINATVQYILTFYIDTLAW